jgi:hypothetical protein
VAWLRWWVVPPAEIVPGRVRQGRILTDGTVKSYKPNGIYLFLIVAVVMGTAQATGVFRLATVHRLFWPLFVVANGFAIAYTAQLLLLGLFVHRAWRDDQRCREKYGDMWVEYCRRARFRMIPFVYCRVPAKWAHTPSDCLRDLALSVTSIRYRNTTLHAI